MNRQKSEFLKNFYSHFSRIENKERQKERFHLEPTEKTLYFEKKIYFFQHIFFSEITNFFSQSRNTFPSTIGKI